MSVLQITCQPFTKFDRQMRHNAVVKYFDFSQVQVEYMPSVKKDQDNILKSSSSAKILMDNKYAFVGILPQETPNFGTNSSYFSGLSKQVSNMLPCLITPNKTIITNPIFPDIQNNDNFKNGLIIDNKTNIQYYQKDGLNWNISSFKSNDDLGTKVASSLVTYGTIKQNSYVDNTISYGKDKIINSSAKILDRTYILSSQTIKDACDYGSFVFCYNIVQSQETVNDKSSDVCPMISCSIGVTKYDISYQQLFAGFSNQQKISSSSKTIDIKIPFTGQLIVQYQSNTYNGELKGSFNQQKMPSQCKKQGQTLLLSPLYVYPIYKGIVIADNIASINSHEHFLLKFQDNNVLDNIQMREVPQDIKKRALSGKAGQYQWFPANYDQYGKKQEFDKGTFPGTVVDNAATECQVNVTYKQQVRFDRDIKITWHRCLGKFAYSPLYFYKDLKVSFLFKTILATSNFMSRVNYYVYPVISINGGIKEQFANGGNSIQDSFDDIKQNGYYAPHVIASQVYYEKEAQQAVYYSEIQCQGKQCLRYPIELHGAIVVQDRGGNIGFEASNQNGDFASNFANVMNSKDINAYAVHSSFQSQFYLNDHTFINYATNLNLQSSKDGCQGSISLDSYFLIDGLKKLCVSSCGVGGMKLVDNQNNVLFAGFGMGVSTNNNDTNNQMGIQLKGVQQKLNDMKIIYCPMWDGDRLQNISVYFQAYTGVQLKMIDYTVTSIDEAKGSKVLNPTDNNTPSDEWWVAKKNIYKGNKDSGDYVSKNYFRAIRSQDWQHPAVNFPAGKSCLEALNQLAQQSGCLFICASDGIGYFYQLDKYGIPYYASNSTAIQFQIEDIISINLKQNLQNRCNLVGTLSHILDKKGSGKGNKINPVVPIYTPHINDVFPWTKIKYIYQKAFISKDTLFELHKNYVRFANMKQYTGQITVAGGLEGKMVNYVYQKIKIKGLIDSAFVTNINHSIDFNTKSWITTYQITVAQF